MSRGHGGIAATTERPPRFHTISQLRRFQMKLNGHRCPVSTAYATDCQAGAPPCNVAARSDMLLRAVVRGERALMVAHNSEKETPV